MHHSLRTHLLSIHVWRTSCAQVQPKTSQELPDSWTAEFSCEIQSLDHVGQATFTSLLGLYSFFWHFDCVCLFVCCREFEYGFADQWSQLVFPAQLRI